MEDDVIRDGFITTQLSGRWKVLWGVLKPGMIQLFSYQWSEKPKKVVHITPKTVLSTPAKFEGQKRNMKFALQLECPGKPTMVLVFNTGEELSQWHQDVSAQQEATAMVELLEESTPADMDEEDEEEGGEEEESGEFERTSKRDASSKANGRSAGVEGVPRIGEGNEAETALALASSGGSMTFSPRAVEIATERAGTVARLAAKFASQSGKDGPKLPKSSGSDSSLESGSRRSSCSALLEHRVNGAGGELVRTPEDERDQREEKPRDPRHEGEDREQPCEDGEEHAGEATQVSRGPGEAAVDGPGGADEVAGAEETGGAEEVVAIEKQERESHRADEACVPRLSVPIKASSRDKVREGEPTMDPSWGQLELLLEENADEDDDRSSPDTVVESEVGDGSGGSRSVAHNEQARTSANMARFESLSTSMLTDDSGPGNAAAERSRTLGADRLYSGEAPEVFVIKPKKQRSTRIRAADDISVRTRSLDSDDDEDSGAELDSSKPRLQRAVSTPSIPYSMMRRLKSSEIEDDSTHGTEDETGDGADLRSSPAVTDLDTERMMVEELDTERLMEDRGRQETDEQRAERKRRRRKRRKEKEKKRKERERKMKRRASASRDKSSRKKRKIQLIVGAEEQRKRSKMKWRLSDGALVVTNPLCRTRPLPPLEVGSDSVTMDLSRRDLEDVPPNLFHETSITILNLYLNMLRTLPRQIANLSALKQLGLNENVIERLPREIGQLKHLEILDLRYNRLESLPDEVATMPSLKRLFLRYNRLVALPNDIGNVSTLELLSVRNNQLMNLPESINKLSSLRVLDAFQNNLSELPSLRGMDNLVDLNVQNNALTDLPVDIHTLPKLRKLHIGNNPFSTLSVSVCALNKLTLLDAEGCVITVLPAEFGNMKGLEQLYLGRNHLTDLPETIGGMTKLKQLYLPGNRLTRIPHSITCMRELKDIDLSTNQFAAFPDQLLEVPLSTLKLRDNNIESLPELHSVNTTLKTLDIGENQLQSIPEDFFSFLPAMSSLRLTCNSLTSLPDSIASLTCLKELELDQNEMEQLPVSVCSLTTISTLSLMDNELNDLPNELLNLLHLTQLKVDGNPFSNIPPRVSGGAAVFQYVVDRVAGGLE